MRPKLMHGSRRAMCLAKSCCGFGDGMKDQPVI
jgi:hypothetical protein